MARPLREELFFAASLRKTHKKSGFYLVVHGVAPPPFGSPLKKTFIFCVSFLRRYRVVKKSSEIVHIPGHWILLEHLY